MMHESLRENSTWSEYLAVLPTKLDSLVFWSAAELEELQASAVLNKIGKAHAEALFGEKGLPLLTKGGSIDNFHHMASTVMAYAFDIPEDNLEDGDKDDSGEELVLDDEMNDPKTILSMVPLADMLNADADMNNARLICNEEHLEMRTIKPILKGEEVLNDYGLLPRSDLLRRYGFVTDNYAIYDVVEISTASIVSAFQKILNLDNQATALEPLGAGEVDDRLDLARREDVLDESYDISHKGSEGTCFQDGMISLIYLLLINSNSLQSIKITDADMPRRSKMETELLGQVLVAILRQRYQDYSTTLEQDSAILETENLPARKMMAVKVRHGEKAVLQEAIIEAASFRGSNDRMRIYPSTREAGQIPKPPKRSRHR
jgi:N-lysine methyltransferase SETD6